MIKKGTISYVAKTGGIKFVEDPETWLNPSNSIKEEVIAMTDELKGKAVVISYKDATSKYFETIQADGEQPPNTAPKRPTSQHNTAWTDKTQEIRKSMLLKIAADRVPIDISAEPREDIDKLMRYASDALEHLDKHGFWD